MNKSQRVWLLLLCKIDRSSSRAPLTLCAELVQDVFSLKGGVLERGLGGALRPPLARNDSMGCEAGAEGKDPTGGALLAVMRDGSGGREDDGRGADESRQAVVAAGRRKGKMGLHVSDALVFSRGVAQQLEAQAEVLSLPFNLQVVSPSPPFLLRACSMPCDSE